MERIFERHCNPELLHAVLQLSPPLPIFHISIPARAHASRVDVAMIVFNPLSPEDKTIPKGAYLPAPHDKHVLSVVAPRVEEYLPDAQLVHNAAPVTDLYVPALHEAHRFRPTPSWPAGQERMQTPEPIDPLLVPVGHAVHGPPSGPVY